jgi:hypothetical protein
VNLPKEGKREKRAKEKNGAKEMMVKDLSICILGFSKMKTLCRVRPKDGGIPKTRGSADCGLTFQECPSPQEALPIVNHKPIDKSHGSRSKKNLSPG